MSIREKRNQRPKEWWEKINNAHKGRRKRKRETPYEASKITT